jgi:hypothetical protein
MLLTAFEWHQNGNDELLDGIAEVLAEMDEARQQLRDMGFGVTGTPVLRQVAEVRERCG